MTLLLRCSCGKLHGEVDPDKVAARAVCYCKDCQAFARFLGREREVLDDAGGTEVAAALPGAVRFTGGAEHLLCMSLSPKGLYRWYAGCCNTPIGNTPREASTPYVGLIRACLDAPPETLNRKLGRSRILVQTGSALAPVKPTLLRTAWAGAKIAGMILRARLTGAYRNNPFFLPGTTTPLRAPRVLSADERAALRRGSRSSSASRASRWRPAPAGAAPRSGCAGSAPATPRSSSTASACRPDSTSTRCRPS